MSKFTGFAGDCRRRLVNNGTLCDNGRTRAGRGNRTDGLRFRADETRMK